jgi:hypoxanthine phosphoribosyltransferase
MEGTLLVVDDITRTGKTLKIIRAFIINTNFRNEYALKRVRFATLLQAELTDTEQYMRPDWSWKLTRHRYVKFPWSTLSAEVRYVRSRASDPAFHIERDQNLQKAFTEYKKIASDYQYALKIAREFIDSRS